MKTILTLLVALFSCLTCFAENDVNSVFYEELSKVQAKYRVGMSALIKKADRVILYLVDFDGIADGDAFKSGDDRESIAIAPYDKRTKILSSKVIEADDRKVLLEVLSTAIAEPEHTGGALCHFPIHGIRIYSEEKLIHEGTFCWVCGNFSFKYPRGSDWLDTNADLEAIFTKLFPIPQSELDRFHTMYPTTQPKEEQDGTEQTATHPDSKSESSDKPLPEADAKPPN